MTISSSADKAQEHLYRIISEQARDCIFCKDTEFRYTYANPAMLALLGCESTDILGKTPVEVFGPDNARIISEVDSPVLEGKVVSETRTLSINGESHSFHTVQVPIVESPGQISGICGVVRDVTERVRLDSIVRIQRDLSLAFSQTTGLGQILDCLVEHLIRIENIPAAAVFMTGGQVDNPEMTVSRGFGPSFRDNFLPVCREVIDSDWQNGKYEYYSSCDSNYSRMIHGEKNCKAFALLPLFYERKLVGMLVLACDKDSFPQHTKSVLDSISGIISGAVIRALTHEALIRSEENLFQSEKMRAVGQLAGGIAHDFNNQLGVILGFADMLREEVQPGSEIAQFAEGIIMSARRATDLTAQLLAFARKGKKLNSILNMHNLISDTANILSRTLDKRISITQNQHAANPMVHGDSSQLQNAIMNIAINSRDAICGNGIIEFRTSNIRFEKPLLPSSSHDPAPGEYLLVEIKDSGCGMDEQTISRIFEPFFTTKDPGKGTGMGLASVYGTVKNHNGFIFASSRQGEGTVISMYLPVTEEKESGLVPEKQANEKSVKARARILMVDDEPMILDLTSRMLKKSGFDYVSSRDGNEAVEYYRDHRDEIDLVILDMIMPGINGRKTYEKMKKINPAVKVIICSGYSIDSEVQKAVDMGAVGFIQKPFCRADLCGKINQALSIHDNSVIITE